MNDYTHLPNTLTVIIRDDAPMIHCGDSPRYRSVVITLTDDQINKIKVRHDEEAISSCILEQKP